MFLIFILGGGGFFFFNVREIPKRTKRFWSQEGALAVAELAEANFSRGEHRITQAPAMVARLRFTETSQATTNIYTQQVLILTNTSLWLLRCKWSGGLAIRGKGQWTPVGHSAISLHELRESAFVEGKSLMAAKTFKDFLRGGGKTSELELTTNSGESILISVGAEFLDLESQIRQKISEIRSGANSVSIADELGKIAELVEAGALQQDDLDRAKALYLGKSPNAQEESLRRLRQLHDLFRSGVLSESEFNMKKWDVLSRN